MKGIELRYDTVLREGKGKSAAQRSSKLELTDHSNKSVEEENLFAWITIDTF
jgi:hypothetical protein